MRLKGFSERKTAREQLGLPSSSAHPFSPSGSFTSQSTIEVFDKRRERCHWRCFLPIGNYPSKLEQSPEAMIVPNYSEIFDRF
jgi:hypothetical protein